MRIVFDLDGTLADDSHRLHLLQLSRKRWNEYMDLCDKDTPIPHTVGVLRSMYAAGHAVEVWTGRPEGEDGVFRTKTMEWFQHNHGYFITAYFLPEFRAVEPYAQMFASTVRATEHIPVIPIRMRPHGDYRSNVDLKRRWLMYARERGVPPHLVFEDQQAVVDMWRSEGIPCFQVDKRDEV